MSVAVGEKSSVRIGAAPCGHGAGSFDQLDLDTVALHEAAAQADRRQLEVVALTEAEHVGVPLLRAVQVRHRYPDMMKLHGGCLTGGPSAFCPGRTGRRRRGSA